VGEMTVRVTDTEIAEFDWCYCGGGKWGSARNPWICSVRRPCTWAEKRLVVFPAANQLRRHYANLDCGSSRTRVRNACSVPRTSRHSYPPVFHKLKTYIKSFAAYVTATDISNCFSGFP
jgi:hypothetical protein